jgi:hypothetical protein
VSSQQLEDRAPGRVTEHTQAHISVSVHEQLGYAYRCSRRKRLCPRLPTWWAASDSRGGED